MFQFNSTVRDIQYNMAQIVKNILEIKKNKDNNDNNNIVEITLINLELLYSIILSKLEEIETSLTFCKLGILHPSIISTLALKVELKNIKEKFYPQIKLDEEDILDVESQLRVSCSIAKDQIRYFISIPIFNPQLFELYNLIPIPRVVNSNFITIAPSKRFFLKDKNKEIKALNSNCQKALKFYCSHQLIDTHNYKCEEEILFNSTSSSCKYTKVEFTNDLMDYIPEINSYLAGFKEPTEIIIKSVKGTKTHLLQGIYLLSITNETSILYRKRELPFASTSNGRPHLLEGLNPPAWDEIKPNTSLALNNIKLRDISSHMELMNPVFPTEEDPNYPKSVIIAGAVLFAIWAIYLIWKRKSDIQRILNSTVTSQTEIPPSNNFPGGIPI